MCQCGASWTAAWHKTQKPEMQCTTLKAHNTCIPWISHTRPHTKTHAHSVTPPPASPVLDYDMLLIATIIHSILAVSLLLSRGGRGRPGVVERERDEGVMCRAATDATLCLKGIVRWWIIDQKTFFLVLSTKPQILPKLSLERLEHIIYCSTPAKQTEKNWYRMVLGRTRK